MRRFVLPVLLGVFLAGAGYQYGVELDFLVEREGSSFVASWAVEVEDGVQRYELLRRTSYGEEIIYRPRPKGAGTVYTYRDENVYKTAAEQVEYQLTVVFESGERKVYHETLAYTPTAIRRTWGSIKAMFQ